MTMYVTQCIDTIETLLYKLETDDLSDAELYASLIDTRHFVNNGLANELAPNEDLTVSDIYIAENQASRVETHSGFNLAAIIELRGKIFNAIYSEDLSKVQSLQNEYRNHFVAHEVLDTVSNIVYHPKFYG